MSNHDFDLGRRWGLTIADIYADEPDSDTRRSVLLGVVLHHISTMDDPYGLVEALADANSDYTCHGVLREGAYCGTCGALRQEDD